MNDTLSNLRLLISQGLKRVQQTPLSEYFIPTSKNFRNLLTQTGETLKKTPSTAIELPEEKVGNNMATRPLEANVELGKKALALLTGLPGEMLRSYGETLTKAGTGKQFGLSDLLNTSDFIPGLGFIGAGVRTTGKKVVQQVGKELIQEGTEKLAKEAGEDLLEKAVINRAVKGTSVLTDIYKDFQAGRNVKRTVGTGNIRGQLLDRLSPVYDFVKNAKAELSAEVNPYKRMRLLAGTSGKVEALIKTGLAPTLKENANRLDDLSAMLLLERENELIAHGLTRKRTQQQILEAFSELQAKHGIEGFSSLQDAAKQVRTYGSKLLDELKNSGVIGDEAYNAIRTKNEFYVPMEAVSHLSDNLEKGFTYGSSFNVARQDVVKAIGSYKDAVADPLEAILRQTSKVVGLSEKNRAMQTLVNLRKIDPYFEEMIKPTKGFVDEGFDVINLFENGKNVAYQVPQAVASAIKNLDAESSNALVKILSPQAKLLRAGATGLNIGFIPANVIRDISDALFTETSEKGVKATLQLIASYPKAIFTAATKGDLYNKWLSAGGAQSTLTEQFFKKGAKSLREVAGKQSVVKKVLTSPKDLVEFANRVGEQSTRIARFSAGLKRGEDIAEAAFKSRDITLDFARSGTVLKTINQVVPFLNASVQGSEKLLRTFKSNPTQAVLYSSLLYGVPSVILYKHNQQFNDYADIPESERLSNWIILARDRTPQEIANNDPIVGVKIPKGFLGRPVSALTESSLDFLKQEDPQAFLSFMKTLGEQVSPIGLPLDKESLGRSLSTLLPPEFKAAIEGATNTNLYFGTPIIPDRLKNVEPAEQYKAGTTEAAKNLGKLLGISPLIIENTVGTTAGGLGKQILKLASGDIKGATVDEVTKRFTNIRSGDSVDKEFDEVAKYAGKASTESLKRSREAEKLYQELKALPKAEANKKAVELQKSDPLMFKALANVVESEKKDMTSLERYVAALPVTDGTRAEYVKDKLNQLESTDEKKALIQLWAFKGIISKNVYQQLVDMKSKGELQI